VWPSPPVVGPLRGPPLCVGPLWAGSLPCRVPVSRGICSSSCLSLVLTSLSLYLVVVRRGAGQRGPAPFHLRLYKILFRFKALVGVHHPLYPPSPLANPTLLQYYCTTIAQYTPSHRPSPFMPYIIQYCALQYRVKAKPHHQPTDTLIEFACSYSVVVRRGAWERGAAAVYHQ